MEIEAFAAYNGLWIVFEDLGGGPLDVLIGRTLGWAMVGLAIVMASAEAVMALGTGAYHGLATSEIWTLLVGQSPSFTGHGFLREWFNLGGRVVMALPAWVVIGSLGTICAHTFRARRRRRRVFGPA